MVPRAVANPESSKRRTPRREPKGSKYQIFEVPDPENHEGAGLVSGTRNLKHWIRGPCGESKCRSSVGPERGSYSVLITNLVGAQRVETNHVSLTITTPLPVIISIPYKRASFIVLLLSLSLAIYTYVFMYVYVIYIYIYILGTTSSVRELGAVNLGWRDYRPKLEISCPCTGLL